MQQQQQPRRRRPRPWDELNETSVNDDDDDDHDYDYDTHGYDVEEGNGYVSLSMQRNTNRGGGAAAAAAAGEGNGGNVVGNGGTCTGSSHAHAAPPNTMQEQPKESTPLLSKQRRRNDHGGGGTSSGGSVAGSSWSSVGASMRFRNPLSRRPTRSASRASHGAGSRSGSGGIGAGSDGNYAPSTATSNANTDVTTNTARTDRTFGSGVFKWRPGGDLMPSRSRAADEDDESWTAGSVVKEFLGNPWNRHGRSSSAGGSVLNEPSGIGKNPSFAYAARPQSRAGFSLGLSILCSFHFGIMALHDIIKLYMSWSTDVDGDAMWLSSAGLVANPLVGPPASTLTTFGATSGVRLLLSSEMWRVLTSLTLSTSIAQLALHLTVLRFGTLSGYLPSMERRWSSKATMALYVICCLCGAATSTALDYPADVTGLVGAGLLGILSASLAEGWLSAVKEMRSDRLGADFTGEGGCRNGTTRSGIAKILLRPGKAHLHIGLEFLIGCFAHTSLWSLAGGLLSGLGCGLFHFSYLLDTSVVRPTSQTYGPSFSTPSKKRPMFGTPPHSPSSHETPPMRRSMIGSPDRDERGYAYSPSMAGDASSPYRSPDRNTSHFVASPPNGERSSNARSGVGTTRFIGFMIALLVGFIPGTLVATGAVGEAWGGTLDSNLLTESFYGCRSMRKLFEAELASGYVTDYVSNNEGEEEDNDDESENLWVCSQTCVPIALNIRARLSTTHDGMGMKVGRCKEVGYRCKVGSGTYLVESGRWWVPRPLRISNTVYELPVTVYRTTDGDGTCDAEDEEGGVYAEDGDDAGGAADEEGENKEENQQQEQNQMQANAYGATGAGANEGLKDLAIDLAEEAVVNAGL